MERLDFTLGRFARIWWTMFWRGTIGVAVIAVLPLLYLDMREHEWFQRWSVTFNLALMPVAILIWAVALHMALRKRYAEFQIALTPR